MLRILDVGTDGTIASEGLLPLTGVPDLLRPFQMFLTTSARTGGGAATCPPTMEPGVPDPDRKAGTVKWCPPMDETVDPGVLNPEGTPLDPPPT